MPEPARPRRVLLMGAAGRDFHNFNMVYRDDPSVRVLAFTAAQIPDIAGRAYPAVLAGPAYPDGIPILDESELEVLIARESIDEVVFAYSDISHADVMHRASAVLAMGADFTLLGPGRTMLASRLPVIAVSAVRTGCGKSPLARWLSRRLRDHGLRVAVLRHPMPYGDLAAQAVQRFASRADLDAAACTVEEREEYEPHIEAGNVVHAGVDYPSILRRAEAEADIVLWDGGNNDFPFVSPDLHIVLVDPLRAGDGLTHHPGEAVLRMADIVVAAKTDVAEEASVVRVLEQAREANPRAVRVRGASPVTLERAETLRGRRVLVVEDGPTLTHGGMAWGAGHVAALAAGAEPVDPRPFATPAIRAIYAEHLHLGSVLPAVGYSPQQLLELEATIRATPADAVVAATPCDLAALMEIDKPVVRARYEFAEVGTPKLSDLVEAFLRLRLADKMEPPTS